MLTPQLAVRQIQQSLAQMAQELQELTAQLAQTLEDLENRDVEHEDWHRDIGTSLHDSEFDGVPRSVVDIDQILLGDALSSDPAIADDRASLLRGLADGSAAALGLVGRLLTFRAGTAEQLPPLLKGIGEAFYQWSDELTDEPVALRNALVRSLICACTSAGLGHRIELVRIGDRFDRAKHVAAAPGFEIHEVQGWVVLRDDGSVYTKAAVSTTSP